MLLILALSFSTVAYGAEVTLIVDSTEIITSFDVSYYVSSDVSGDPDITVPARQLIPPYRFTSIKDAMEFANGPLAFIAARPDRYDTSIEYSADVEYYADIAITLNLDDCLGDVVQFSSYSNVTNVTINQGGTTRTLYTSGDRHFICDNSSATITFENLTISGRSPGGVTILGGTANFNRVLFQNMSSTAVDGGAVNISGGSATFNNCDFYDNSSSTNGGAVNISNGDANFTTCVFSNDVSTLDGGAVNITGGNSISFNNCTFMNNNASTNGGAINITGGTAIAFNAACTFTSNHADINGGALNIAGGNSLTFSAAQFTTNTSGLGGALYVSAGNLTFNGANPFTSNSATNGGAMYIAGGSGLTFSNMNTFASNTATNNGGAIYLEGSLTPDFSNQAFRYNVALNGGALYLRSPAIIGGTFSNNFANKVEEVGGNGGAVYIDNSSSSSATFNAVSFSSNSADVNGGALYINSPAIFNESTFSTNYANQDGGAVYIAGGTPLTFEANNSFTSNIASNYGGAMYVNGGSTNLSFTGSNEFLRNYADDSGGAIYIKSGSSTNFSGTNIFRENYSPEGGAVSINSSSNIPSFNGVEFNNNSADNRGGTIAIFAGGATLNNTTTFNTSSSDNGGAIYLSGGTLTISSDTTFTDINGNEGGILHMAGGIANIYAPLENAVANNGGAIYMSNGEANIYGALSTNKANDNGGAICMSGDALPVANIHNNLVGNYTVNGNGGAIFIVAGTASISGDTSASEDLYISRNEAAEYGGAIYINSPRAQLDILGNCPIVFRQNQANDGGGAIYAYEGIISNFTPQVTFSRNSTVHGNGGALWFLIADQLPNGTLVFDNNQSHCDSLYVYSTADPKGNGGAIYIASDIATNIMLDNSKQYTFDGNIADQYGGGIQTLASNIILDGFVVATENSAKHGGGFAASDNGKIYIRNNSSISNQWAPSGGAFYAPDIYVTSSDLMENHTELIEGGENGHGGGAIFATRHLEVLGAYFDSNYTTQQTEGHGGAIYVNGSSDDVKVTNSLFVDNSTTKGNGGSIYCDNITGSVFEFNTFRENSSGNDGGAIYIQGNNFTIKKCYFEDNNAYNNGGAVYFAQPTEGTSPTFTMNYSMFKGNNAVGDQGGGALYIGTVNARIDSCTFTENYFDASRNSGAGFGGALYLVTTTPTENLATIDSCTFYKNRIDNGDDDTSGGGALYVFCEKGRIRSCTFTSNSTAGNGGGAICLASGTLSISGTIAVGNTSIGRYDIRLYEGASRIISGGYNRIGKFSQGSGEADFKSVTSNVESDRTSWLNKTWMTSKQSYFGNNELAVNRYASEIPPSIGSTLGTGKVILLTLMLNEAADIPFDDRATSKIPYSRRSAFPALDERGATRASVANVPFDIGAINLGVTNTGGGTGETAYFSVERIQMSGVPTELRRVGQTASLVAKVYYTNGAEAYGGTGENEEPVKWSSEPSDYYVHIDENTGDLVVLRTTSSPESNTYVTITVETVRTDEHSNTFKDSQYLKITEGDFTYLNTSPQYSANYLREIINDFIEYNIGFGLADVSSTPVSSSTFQNNFASVWNTPAFQVSDLTTSQPRLTTSSNYSGANGYVTAKDKGVTIDFDGRNIGDIFPVVYSWKFTGSELEELMSRDLGIYGKVGQNGIELNSSVAEGLFRVLKLEFQGAEDLLQVIGPESVSAKDAYDSGALALNKADGNRGVQLELTAYIANVTASGNSTGSRLIDSDGSKLLVVPDGVPDDGKIYGTMWLVKPGESNYVYNPETSTASENSSDGENGGGGCNSLLAGGFAMLMACLIFIKQK